MTSPFNSSVISRKKSPISNTRLTGFPFVDDTVCVVEEYLLPKGVEGLVQLEPGVAGGEGGDKNVGLGPSRGVILDAGVNSFQNVVGT